MFDKPYLLIIFECSFVNVISNFEPIKKIKRGGQNLKIKSRRLPPPKWIQNRQEIGLGEAQLESEWGNQDIQSKTAHDH